MAAELNFSPPEVPEPTFLENLLRYGLFLGAIFQLICVLAIIFPISKSHEGGGRMNQFYRSENQIKIEGGHFEPRKFEVTKKPKGAAPSQSKKSKKETKKKR